MLAADKLQLQSHVKQQATALKEKEFNLHHSNLMTVGTQAAVLAGLDMTMFIEFHPADDVEWISSLASTAANDANSFHFLNPLYIPRILKFLYYITIVSAFCANILVVGQTSILSVMGASLALRGPDGSMMTATNGIYEERTIVFKTFAYGLISTIASVTLCIWLMCNWETCVMCNICSAMTLYVLWKHYERIKRKFLYDENDTVDFNDLFKMGSTSSYSKKKMMMKKKKRGTYSPKNRQHQHLSDDYDDSDDDNDYDDEEQLYSNSSDDLDLHHRKNTRKRLLVKDTKAEIGGGRKSDYYYHDKSRWPKEDAFFNDYDEYEEEISRGSKHSAKLSVV
mmetsp:Transcript_27589/g.32190  ORF Transcript_27589/g.32190 Transcript_27589/m.32190 type:complete len:338 (+) Transcript_27589:134-1147(+)